MKTEVGIGVDRTTVQTFHDNRFELTVFRDVPMAAEQISILHERLIRQQERIAYLELSLESEQRENRLRRAELTALNDRLAWSNVNGGMAYVLRGVGHGEVWQVLRDARDKQRAIEEGTKHDD
jgi:hypothetical protein